MSKIRIAFFISNLNQGGAEKQMVLLLKALDTRYYEKYVYLYAYQKNAFFQEVFDFPGVTVRTNTLKRRIPPFKICEAGMYIRKQLSRESYDIVFSSLFLNNVLVRLFGPGKYRNRFVCNVRTSFDSYTRMRLAIERMQIRKSHMVFNSMRALSSFKAVMPKKYDSRLSLIYNGFEQADLTKSYKPVNKNQLMIGCLGRMGHEKNFIQVIRVFKHLKADIPGLSLIIQGSAGDQYEEIYQEAGLENLEIRDRDLEIDSFFRSIDVLVISSLFEGCPNVLFEALLRKKFCIISEGANSDTFISNAQNGLVYDGSDTGLALAIQNFISIYGTDSCQKIMENGFSYAQENFSISRLVDQYINLFRSIHGKN